jgi:hypothetical protein
LRQLACCWTSSEVIHRATSGWHHVVERRRFISGAAREKNSQIVPPIAGPAPDRLALLLGLAGGPLHGFRIMKDVECCRVLKSEATRSANVLRGAAFANPHLSLSRQYAILLPSATSERLTDHLRTWFQ